MKSYRRAVTKDNYYLCINRQFIISSDGAIQSSYFIIVRYNDTTSTKKISSTLDAIEPNDVAAAFHQRLHQQDGEWWR
jgi:hypothetical protein